MISPVPGSSAPDESLYISGTRSVSRGSEIYISGAGIISPAIGVYLRIDSPTPGMEKAMPRPMLIRPRHTSQTLPRPFLDISRREADVDEADDEVAGAARLPRLLHLVRQQHRSCFTRLPRTLSTVQPHRRWAATMPLLQRKCV